MIAINFECHFVNQKWQGGEYLSLEFYPKDAFDREHVVRKRS